MASQRAAPLDGVRVVALEQYGAGPFGTMLLADMGAEVIKIEDPSVGGDVSRYIPPGQQGTDSLFFETFNRGKKSLGLDLKSAAGREVFHRLVANADAVYNNLRGDQPARLRITYEHLGTINPAIVCVSLTGYGRYGPGARLPGYDALVQAESGWAALTGEPEGPPTKSGLSLADYIAGVVSVLGLMIALFDARRTGIGRDVDTNLYDAALAMLTYPATWYLSLGVHTERQPLSAHPSVIPFQFFRTADGYVAVACPKEKFFTALLTGMQLDELVADERLATFERRREHRRQLLERLSGRFAELPTAAWLDRLRGKVPIAPVRSMEQALDLEELTERQMLAAYEHPVMGLVRSVASPLRLGGFIPSYAPGPALDSDRDEILASLGYSREQRQALAATGAFGARPVAAVDRSTATPG